MSLKKGVTQDVAATGATAQSIARRFQVRLMEQAKEGRFGSIRTRKPSLQKSYILVMSQLDNTALPLLIYGEYGSGKQRHVKELLTAQNFLHRLEGRRFGKLKIFQAKSLEKGFTQQFLAPHTSADDLIYLEAVDQLKESCQIELLKYLKMRDQLSEGGVEQPRLVIGTAKALSILVVKDRFHREVFERLTEFAVFLPSLNERAEDMPQLIKAIAEELSGRQQNPPAWLVDLFSHQLWPQNLSELQKVIASVLTVKPKLSEWTLNDLPAQFQPKPQQSKTPAEDGEHEHNAYKRALIRSGGDRQKAAQLLGMSQSEFLKKILLLGLR